VETVTPVWRSSLAVRSRKRAIFFHFLGVCQVELIVIAARPAISDVKENELRVKLPSQFRDVGQQGSVGPGCFPSATRIFYTWRQLSDPKPIA